MVVCKRNGITCIVESIIFIAPEQFAFRDGLASQTCIRIHVG